ncbi:hypothetical protein [Thalassovita aquimarina]|nr:hypothetical protein [Thalassovita aquimarina]
MYADEADQDGSKEYLIFAAVFIPANNAINIHRGMEKIRANLKLDKSTEFKFSPGKLPKGISRQDHAEAKSEVLRVRTHSQ